MKSKLRSINLSISILLLLTSCDRTKSVAQSSPNADAKPPISTLDKWSWLPSSSKHDTETVQIPKDAKAHFSFPKDAPLNLKQGDGKITSSGEFIPTDAKSILVNGGFISEVGSIKREAKWTICDFVYGDSERKQPVGWGPCLTSGDIILPRSMLLQAPANNYVQNSFEIAAFGDDFVLIHLDPLKGHQLCFMKAGRGLPTTAGFLGTKAEVGGKVFERKADGWYLGSTRMSN